MGKNFLIYFRERFPSLQVYNLKQKSGIKPHKTKQIVRPLHQGTYPGASEHIPETKNNQCPSL